MAATTEVLTWLRAREPGVDLRSLSVDLVRPRVLLTLVPPPGERPRALRFDPPSADELIAAAHPAESVIAEACLHVLRQRERKNSTLDPR